MVSPELIRRYAFFAGLNQEHIVTLATLAEEITLEKELYLFHEKEDVKSLYLVVEGKIAIVNAVPDRDKQQKIAGQLTGNVHTKDIVVSTVEPGETLGWVALVPPHQATAGARSLTFCRMVAFDGPRLREKFEHDYYLGYLMMQKMAQVIQDRLNDTRIRFLAYL